MQKNWLYFIATGQRADLKSEPLTFSDLLDPKILRIDKESHLNFQICGCRS